MNADRTDGEDQPAGAQGEAPGRPGSPPAAPRSADQRRAQADRRFRGALTRPVRLVPLSFLGVILLGTGLLMLPAAHAQGHSPDLMVAAFTSVSAVCVTGLTTVDTATHWSPLGQGVILLLCQVGGFGIMTLATLLSLLVRGKLGVVGQLRARAESHAFDTGSVAQLVRRIAVSMLAAEAIVGLCLTIRFRIAYQDSLADAAWHGVFHSISAFTNASFMLYSDGFVRFVDDPWVCLPVCAAIIAGGIGYPVFFELGKQWRHPHTWGVTTRLTVGGTAVLLVTGLVAYLLFEWTNPRTLGDLPVGTKVLAASTASVVARTAGFNTIDYASTTSAALVATVLLMFVGGGSAGTAGGIKVTTFFLLGFVILAEARGDTDVVIGHRRISPEVQRQAVTVALLGAGVVAAGTIALVVVTGLPLDAVVFEVVSAFGTVGLSTGITAKLNAPAQLILMVLMFTGRVGPVALASALALRTRTRLYHHPTERPLVG